MNDQWGVGNQADAKAFDVIEEGELIFGEHPHSRRDNNVYLRRANGDIVPFDGFRRKINIEITSENYEKESNLSGDEIRKSVTGKVFVDGVQLIEEFGRDPQVMLRHLDRLIDVYSEHESGWFNKKDRENMIGRKIWYYSQKATIIGLIEDQNAIMIETESDFKPPVRDMDDEDDMDDWIDWKVGGHYEIKDEVLSPHIWWWRK